LGQEFIIKSQNLEDKVNQLLPSQGGFQAGVDLSASTTIIPIVDLTESAEGSILRQDLQTAIGLNSTVFSISNSTNTTIINTTGYYRIIGNISLQRVASTTACEINITDGTTTKILLDGRIGVLETAVGVNTPISFDFVCKINAGETLRGTAAGSFLRLQGSATQIADINGNLT
tara:strand:+ start:224 stop:745 length:522 start_codon:yes stop_codon:yes gene_type:complete